MNECVKAALEMECDLMHFEIWVWYFKWVKRMGLMMYSHLGKLASNVRVHDEVAEIDASGKRSRQSRGCLVDTNVEVYKTAKGYHKEYEN